MIVVFLGLAEGCFAKGGGGSESSAFLFFCGVSVNILLYTKECVWVGLGVAMLGYVWLGLALLTGGLLLLGWAGLEKFGMFGLLLGLSLAMLSVRLVGRSLLGLAPLSSFLTAVGAVVALSRLVAAHSGS